MSLLPSRENAEPVNGWYWPKGARTAHYFDRNALYSQCAYYEYGDRGELCRVTVPKCRACQKGMGQ